MVKQYGKKQMLRVEIKSEALIREGKKSLITYFQGGNDQLIIHDVKQYYPQYMNPEDKPVVNITQISKTDYNFDRNTKRVNEKQMVVGTRADVMKAEDYSDETLAN